MLNNSPIYQNKITGEGCVGGFFRFPNQPTLYGISNNHVIANLNNCAVGDRIFDLSDNEIGTLSHWFNLDSSGTNFIDAALFRYTGNSPVGWRLMTDRLIKPQGFIEPRLRGRVYMMQSDNMPRIGWISKPFTNTVMNFRLSGQNFSFSHLVEITPFDGRPFSVAGNSGSIIMSSNHFIVGLLLGIETGGIKAYAIPFVNGILDSLSLVI